MYYNSYTQFVYIRIQIYHPDEKILTSITRQ